MRWTGVEYVCPVCPGRVAMIPPRFTNLATRVWVRRDCKKGHRFWVRFLGGVDFDDAETQPTD